MMFFTKKIFFCLFVLIGISLTFIKSEVVCSEDELVRELVEDLEDNGFLIYFILLNFFT